MYNNQGLGFGPSQLGLAGSDRHRGRPPDVPGASGRRGYVRAWAATTTGAAGSIPARCWRASARCRARTASSAGFEGRQIRTNVWEARDSATLQLQPELHAGTEPDRGQFHGGQLDRLAAARRRVERQPLPGVEERGRAEFLLRRLFPGRLARLSRKLTLNLGLRYDYDHAAHRALQPLQLVRSLGGVAAGAQFPGPDRADCSSSAWTDIRARSTSRIATTGGRASAWLSRRIRRRWFGMGYGHLFGISPQEAIGTVGPYGFRVENTWQTSADGGSDAAEPAAQSRTRRDSSRLRARPNGLLTAVGGPIQAPLQATFTPWSMQWNFTIQRELTHSMMLEAAYVGTRGLQFRAAARAGSRSISFRSSLMSLGSKLLDTVDNPFYVAGGPGFFGTKTVARNQLLRPYPQFTRHLPAVLERVVVHVPRASGHAEEAVSARACSSRDPTRGRRASITARAGSGQQPHPAEPRDHRSRRAASLHPELRLRAAVRPRPAFRQPASRWSTPFLGGWMLDGISNYQSGTAFGVSANNVCRCFNQASYANSKGYSGELEGARRGPSDEAGSTPGAFSQPDPFTIGNMGPRSADLRVDKVANWDLGARQGVPPDGEGAPEVPRGRAERRESSAVQRAEYERHVGLVRHRQRTGECAAAGAVGTEVVVVVRGGRLARSCSPPPHEIRFGGSKNADERG